jgi:hypothetical protein
LANQYYRKYQLIWQSHILRHDFRPLVPRFGAFGIGNGIAPSLVPLNNPATRHPLLPVCAAGSLNISTMSCGVNNSKPDRQATQRRGRDDRDVVVMPGSPARRLIVGQAARALPSSKARQTISFAGSTANKLANRLPP